MVYISVVLSPPISAKLCEIRCRDGCDDILVTTHER